MNKSTAGLTTNIFVSSGKVWRWQLDIIQLLQAEGLINVCGVKSVDSKRLSLAKSIQCLHQCDAKIFRSPLTAFELVDADLMMPRVALSSDSEVSTDILINFSETQLSIEIYEGARVGVLETNFSLYGELKSQQLAIKEYLEGLKQVYFSIVLTGQDQYRSVLHESRSSLDDGSLSRNLNQYFKTLQSAWKRVITKLSTGHNTVKSATAITSANNSTYSITDSPRLYQRFGSNVLGKLLQKYKHNEQWILLLQMRGADKAESMPLNFSDYIELIPPQDVFWADPFVVSDKGRHFIFFEELPFETEQGHLSCTEVFKDGSYSPPKVILKQPYHLSYPNIFEHESKYYMIPETGDHGSIELYQCTSFPYQWEHKHTLITGLHAYDSTLLEYDGHWWLFATVAAEKGMSGNDELHIFYASSPIANSWEKHGANPVICDASTARPAGKFFKVGSDWYRPSQDCAGHYGAGLNMNKIIQLDADTYIEQKVETCRPEWSDELIALHTLNFNNDVAVADALRVTSKGIF